jgi:hypothetical protein
MRGIARADRAAVGKPYLLALALAAFVYALQSFPVLMRSDGPVMSAVFAGWLVMMLGCGLVVVRLPERG